MIQKRPTLAGFFAMLTMACLSAGCDAPNSDAPAIVAKKETPAATSQEDLQTVIAQKTDAPGSETKHASLSYEKYDALLQAYVDDQGLVNYADLKANRADLDAFISSMASIQSATYEGWSENEQLAFWINAYNAITLQRIVDHYPIKKGSLLAAFRYPDNSIRQIPGVWEKLTTNIMGQSITLDAIEHDVLRVDFEEPRIHAAIVCAALSCPPLRREAFAPERLDEQLDDQSRLFLGHASRFRIDRAKNRVYLSSILKWFDEDFVGVYNVDGRISGQGAAKGAVLDFASRYVSDEDARFLRDEDYKVSFLDYDWTLNEK